MQNIHWKHKSAKNSNVAWIKCILKELLAHCQVSSMKIIKAYKAAVVFLSTCNW